MTNIVKCIKLGQELEGLDRQPVPGELGEKIVAGVSKQAWQAWLQHQTMLINEHRLSMADADARKFLLNELDKYFFTGSSS